MLVGDVRPGPITRTLPRLLLANDAGNVTSGTDSFFRHPQRITGLGKLGEGSELCRPSPRSLRSMLSSIAFVLPCLLSPLCTGNSVLHLAKRGIPLDSNLPLNLRESHHVLKEDDDIWDAKLSLSHSVANKNKFYIIQLLEPDSGQRDEYYIWTRWGRVGDESMRDLHSSCALI